MSSLKEVAGRAGKRGAGTQVQGHLQGPEPPRFWDTLQAVPQEVVIHVPQVSPAHTGHQEMPSGLQQPRGCAEQIITRLQWGQGSERTGCVSRRSV